MVEILSDLVKLLQTELLSEKDVISWGSPILSFGNLNNCQHATVGINPSNREFVDKNGKELSGDERRFHTLESLGIIDWSNLTDQQYTEILETYTNYFQNKPYDMWFKKLEKILPEKQYSYYSPISNACHIDLVPFATSKKWGELTRPQQKMLRDKSANSFRQILIKSPIKILILNGKTVVDYFVKVTGATLKREEMHNWELKRSTGKHVQGFSYKGVIDKVVIAKGVDIELNRKILVLGFNHNIQGSYGVTGLIQTNIKSWIAEVIEEHNRSV